MKQIMFKLNSFYIFQGKHTEQINITTEEKCNLFYEEINDSSQ